MAKVEYHPRRTEVVVVQEEEFVLTLNREEAEIIQSMLGTVASGGHLDCRITDRIYMALMNEGIHQKYHPNCHIGIQWVRND